MFFTLEKLSSRIEELEKYRYINRQNIEIWHCKEDISKNEKYPPEVDSSWGKLEKGDQWTGRDRYFWLSTEVSIPNPDYGRVIMLFDFGKTDGGTNSGFESLLFIDGKPYQGVDGNHKEVLIGEEYYGKKVKVSLKLWTGLEGGGPPQINNHNYKYSDLAFLHPEVDDLYFTSNMILKTVKILDDNNHEKWHLQKILNDSYKLIDWSDPGNEVFYYSCIEANKQLQSDLDKLNKHTPVTVTAIGHTHIDVAWLWRLKHTREKSARSFSTVLRLMEQYPDYYFLQSQPQLYAYIKAEYPEIYSQINNRVKDGKWEIDGAMWLEADCNISSGESLVRQILYGTKFMMEEFGKKPKFLWLPDVFGYSWALPQILKKTNLDTFMTTKISWNQYNRMPHDTFWWRGIDGSEVLTHFISTPEPEDYGTDSFFYTYNGVIEPKTVKGTYDNYVDKDINHELLLAYGHGDGGGGVNREMLENRRRLDKIPGLPNVKTGSANEYFDNLHNTIMNSNNYVHTWDGELYLEYHRGTYTSQAFMKKTNRKLEQDFRETEFLNTWATIDNKDLAYPKDVFLHGWHILLRNQFHDIIPGTSIKEVYEDSKIEYQEASDLITEINDTWEKTALTNDENTWSVINSATWDRDEIVHILEENPNLQFKDESGKLLEATKVSDGYKVFVSDIPSLGYKTIKSVEEIPNHANQLEFIQKDNRIETPFYIVSWNGKGQLDAIYDKKNDRQILAENRNGNVFQLFEDKPMNFDAWDIDIYYQDKYKELEAEIISVKEKNSLFIEVEFSYNFGQSTLTQSMILYKDSKRIDFNTKVDWHERQQLLKAAFPVNIRATEATYDIQFGNVKRPTHWNTSWDMAKFESVAHQWVDLSEYKSGISLLNDCKYGHDVKDNVLRLTLLKGPTFPDPDADIGYHEFTYSLYPHQGDFITGETVQAAWELNNPLHVCKGKMDSSMEQLLEISGEPNILIDAIKQPEGHTNGMLIRFHDYSGGTQKFSLKPNFAFKSWMETNLLEEETGSKEIAQRISIELKPYEIKTILIEQ
ncbi:alpha-mannosidase [Virgibacillus necropolis]|uniref:Alpha-mannosidase n=1 Tax=Virgibacillus necropolis TaxID=163877 RepID=A0A221M9I9_9BACI|nr:alpha-mannosidase [Virgibacillus necropolis]ASN04318.1 alpha-mannosidase [Virgibacillus necropolis]